ncbi:MAG TPA: glycine cleavage T C-terminal barrel domain-containing protein [Terriglobales bacterium]|nr:glycine cleavage T C-terminal barrel domain-containing protein [Terriglobales bacterium]
MAQKNSAEASVAQPATGGPKTDDGDVRSEFQALISASGVYDLGSRARISLTGSDRVRWLNGMVTNNIRDLEPGRGVYAFLLNPQGHILGDLYAYNRGESLLVDTEQAQVEKIIAVFDKYIIMDDVEVANISEQTTTIGIAGPKSRQVMLAAGLEIPELAPLQFAEISWQQARVTLVRGDNPSVESSELWVAPGENERVHEALVKAGAEPVGTTALEQLRIAAGIPRYGVDIRERDLPQETEQDRALNFSKGCYVGQEIVERIRSRGQVRRKFTGFEIDGPLPAAGTKVQVDGKDAGEITSAASLPVAGGNRPVALGYIRREFAAPGKPVDAGGSAAAVAKLPFAEIFK